MLLKNLKHLKMMLMILLLNQARMLKEMGIGRS